MSKSSIDLLVEFHTNSSDEDAETTTITNEEDGTKSRQPRKKNQKQFKVFEYLSIPPPRTTQLDLVKKKLVEQYPEEINNVDSIESIIFMPFVDGSITQGRSTSGKVPLRQEEKEDDDDDDAVDGEKGLTDKVAPIKTTTKDEVSLAKRTSLKDSIRRSLRTTKSGRKRISSRIQFSEIQDDSWRPKQQLRASVIAERRIK